MPPADTPTLSSDEKETILAALEARFEKHPHRHPGVAWPEVQTRLEKSPAALRSLHEMERTGGEPDVIGAANTDGAFVFMDCSAETPKDRRSLCYDEAALESRKHAKPAGSAGGMAAAMGVEFLSEEEYRLLQGTGAFDAKTSSWIRTPENIRTLGGALFCDRRYGQVFVYHNGAESYYAARAFRASLRV